jgi:hypothetical protein
MIGPISINPMKMGASITPERPFRSLSLRKEGYNHDLAKVGVEGSNPFARSRNFKVVKLNEDPRCARAFRFLSVWKRFTKWAILTATTSGAATPSGQECLLGE